MCTCLCYEYLDICVAESCLVHVLSIVVYQFVPSSTWQSLVCVMGCVHTHNILIQQNGGT